MAQPQNANETSAIGITCTQIIRHHYLTKTLLRRLGMWHQMWHAIEKVTLNADTPAFELTYRALNNAAQGTNE